MPSLVMVVVEEHHVGEIMVIIDDVCQVHHCFIAFVLGNGERVWVVGHVDVWCPVCLSEGRVQPG